MTLVTRRVGPFPAVVAGLLGILWSPPVHAQLSGNCVVAVLNRTVQVNADGTWILPNIPAGFGLVRARATCVNNGITTFGQSGLFTVVANRMSAIPAITLGSTTPIPTSIAITAATSTLTQAGATTQLTASATFAGTVQDVTAANTGTQYNVSNPAIATVSTGGLVTAVSSGTVVIQAVNEGAQGIINIHVILAGASHGGIPDPWAIAHGLDPNDPAMPFEDPDHDGVTNLQEFQNGTDPRNPDTDRDGLTDGQEVLLYHTNPLLFSTDGSGIPDGIEVQTNTLGGSPSAKLAAALSSIDVKPTTFVLTVNSIQGQANQQLTVTGHLIDGKTLIDLTSTQTGTNYSPSDLNVCNFGSPDGNVFAGSSGPCTITVKNGAFTAQASGTVTGFTPKALSFITIPGFANGVAVNGNTAVVAAGTAGLQVADVTDRSNPYIIGSLALPGNANEVQLLSNFAYVAAGSGGLHVVDVTNPTAPVLRGTLSTGGNALDVVVRGTTAYIANGTNLFLANVLNPAFITQIGTLSLTGNIQGVDVDSQRNLAVVAAGTTGIYVVDISNPSAPVVRGQASTGDARDVAIGGNYAFVADYQNSTTSVDLTSPSAPVVLSHITDPNLGGFLQDIVLSGNFALAADVKFVNGVPITDISDPTHLQPRAILNFTQRDDNGMGIAADGSFVYLVTEHNNISKFGSSGDSRLYIGQYLAQQDLKGIAPTASITSPVAGATVIQGATLPVTVKATDDVAVAAVNFLVNGQVVFTATTQPYQFNFTVPTGIASLTLGATAVDFGGNVGTAPNVIVSLIPDPLTTVIGRVVDLNGQPLGGARVTVFGTSGSVTANDGTFSISGVPTIQGGIVAFAAATINGTTQNSHSSAVEPAIGATTNVGTIFLGPAIVVVNRSSTSIHVLDVGRREIASTLNLGTDAFDVAVTPDGRTAVVTSTLAQLVTFLDLSTSPPNILGSIATPIYPGPLPVPTYPGPVTMSITPNGFAVVGGEFTVLSIDIARRQIVSTLSLFPDGGGALTVTPNGKVLVCSLNSNVIRVINMSSAGILSDTGISVSSGGTGGFVYVGPVSIAVSPNGQTALVGNAYPANIIGVLRIAADGSVTYSGTSIHLPNNNLGSIAFTQDGSRAYVAEGAGVGVLNIDMTGNVTDSGIQIAGAGAFYGISAKEIAVMPGGTQVLVRGRGVVNVIDVATNTVIATIPIPNDSSGGGMAIIP